jgi:DNA-directed RNA polymerase subunit RPC12/RpoP
LNDYDKYELEGLKEFDALIINCTRRLYSYDMVKTVRSHDDEQIYLLPIFFYNNFEDVEQSTSSIADGVLHNMQQLGPSADIVRFIQKKQRELKPFTGKIDYEALVLNKTLRFMYTRDRESFEPVTDRASKIGYSYSIASANFNMKSEHKVLDIFKHGEEEGLFSSEFVEIVYLCNTCSNGYLNYREVCPRCSSSDLLQEDLIHHFRCAYVGPQKDYISQYDKNELQCPKCDKYLKHIGIDYDKPSVVYSCNNCDQVFQDMQVYANCFHCHSNVEVENLLKREIRRYEVTQKGIFAAINGIASGVEELASINGTIPIATLNSMLEHEIERKKIVPQIESKIACINMINIGMLYSIIGGDKKFKLLNELVQVVRIDLRKLDIISFKDSTVMIIYFSEASNIDTWELMRYSTQHIKELISNNFDNFALEVTYNVSDLSITVPRQEQIIQLIKDSKFEEE